MSKIAGIDLGTTFSAISILNENGKPEIVKNFEGGYLTPSVVGFPSDKEGACLVGEDAVQLHGGMGVSEEMSIGHYLKRFIAIDSQFGNSHFHLKKFNNS